MDKTPMNHPNPLLEKDYFNKALIKLAVIIFALLIIFLVAIYFIQKNTKLTEQNINQPPPQKAIAAIIPKEAAKVYYRSGTITDVRANYLTVSSQVRTDSDDPAQAYTTRILTVYFDANTVFIKSDYRNFNQTMVIPTPQPASKSELAVGNVVKEGLQFFYFSL